MSVLYSVSSWGQSAAGYNFAASAGTYTPITGGTVFFATGATYDDNTSASITIPSFTYAGTAYTVLRVNTNGWCSFGAATSTTGYTPLSGSVTAASAVLAPFGEDQQNSATSEIRYEDTGTEFVVQWKDVRRFGTTETLNYQLRLQYSASPQTFSYVYGTMTNGADTNPQVGHKTGAAAGTIGTTLFNLTLGNIPGGTSCDWIDAVRGRLNSSTMLLNTTTNSNVTCASGTTFTFTPQTGTWVAPVTTFAAATGVTSSTATVSWTAPANATQYDVQYRAVGTCGWTQFSTGQAGTSAAFTGLTPLTSYQVRVRPRSASESAAYSHCALGNGTANSDGYTTSGYFTTSAAPPTITATAPSMTNFCATPGQSVVITGTFFTAVSSVTFNGVAAASYVVNSTTQITAVTPVGISAGDLVVTTAAGASNNWAYGVVANPVVTLSPNDTIATCGTYSQVVTASGALNYAWNAISGSIGDLSSTTVANPTVASTGNGVYRVIGTDADGCTGFDTLVVNNSAAPYVAITPSIGQFCGSGGTSNIVASSVNPNYTYAFSALNGGSVSNITATSADFTVSQTSAIRVTATDNIGFCAAIRDTAIGVLSFPTLAMASTPDTICVGGTSVLSSGLSAGNFSVTSIAHNPATAPGSAGVLMNNGVAVTALSGGTLDDGGWAGIPIGFTFNYFGSPFTTIAAGTNGLLMFGTVPGYGTGTGQLGQFSFTGPIFFPNAANPGNVIALLAADMQMANSTSGSIRYWTEGYAPYRKFVIAYTQVHGWSNNPAATVQCHLYETTGIVEVHLANKSFSNAAIIGLQDATQTIGAVAPGRNGGTWTVAVGEGWRFTPPSNYTTTWTPSGDISGSNSGTNFFTRTTNALSTPGTNTFTLVAIDQTTGCQNGTGDTVDVEVLAIPANVGASEVSAYGSVLGAGSADNSSPLNICGAQTYTANFTGTLGGLESIRWYDAATGGTLLASGSTYVSGSVAAGTNDTIYVEITNGFCSSASRTMYVVENATPDPVTITSLGPDNDINCGVALYDMDYQASSVNDPNYTYTWSNDGAADSFTDNGSGSATVQSDETTVSTVSAFDAGSGCAISALVSFSIYALPTPTMLATPDTICVGDSTVLSSGVTQGNFSVTPCISAPSYAPLSGTATYLVQNGVEITPTTSCNFCPLDDAGWGGIPIGFDFNFFGTDYDSLNVGTNGNVLFGAYNATAINDFTFASLPSVTEPFNMIALCAVDMDAENAGSDISYFTTGVAPNRIFVLDYTDMQGFSNNGFYSMQLQLHETTGYFEIHVGEASGTGAKSIGVNNGDGTVGAAAPRCAGGLWSGNTATILGAFPQAWGFIPPVDYTFAWSPSGEISGALDGATAVGLPTTVTPGEVGYELLITDNISGCDNSANPDSVFVTVIAAPVAPTVTGAGDLSAVSTSNVIDFCGDQTVTMSVTAGGSAGWTAHYYDDAGLTNEVFLANPYSATYVTAELSDSLQLWVTLDNGICEGPAQLVALNREDPEAITITNDSPSNCGDGPFTANLSASSATAYTYTWDANPFLTTTSGANTTVLNVVATQGLTVNGDDGYCFTSASTSVSVYDLPTVTPTASVDSVCAGGTSILSSNVSATSFTFTSIGYSPKSSAGETVTNLVVSGVDVVPTDGFPGDLDDGSWSGIPIGFTFNFFGTPVTTCNASTNGNIQFASANTTFTPGAIPSATDPDGFVAYCWADLVMDDASNSLRYWTGGVAPNRYFAISATASFFSGGGEVTGQIELYETTGEVRIFIQSTGGNTTSNKVVGIENLDGSDGGVPTGRNLGPWNVSSPEGWLGSPPRTYSFEWLPAAEITGPTDETTATASPSATTNYGLIVQDDVTLCFGDTVFLPVIVTTVPPTASWTASPTLGTTGGITTTHVVTNNSTNVNGATYQWTFTPATVSYVNGTSATDREPEVQFNEPGLYSAQMIITTCTGSDTLNRNNYFNITAEYCFGSFFDDGFICTGCADDNLNNVSIIDPSAVTIMANLGTGCSNIDGYIEYAPVNGVTSCTMYRGSTYTLSVATSGGFTEYYAAWIDVDNDGDFDDPLEFMGATAVSSASTTFSIGVPSSNVVYGPHRMRVMCNFFGPIGATDYCVDDCYGEIEDYTVIIAPPIIPNDIPTLATAVSYSSNTNYPNCYPINGSTASATNSPESNGSGADVWYRFVAQSTAASITMTSSVIDDMVSVYYQDINGAYILVDAENSSVGIGDFERLNVDGLTPGTTYYVSVGAVNAPGGSGAFQLCIQHLMPSWCSYVIPVGGFGLCDGYKAQYRGAPSQGVTYDFNFTGVGGGAPAGPTAITGTNGLTTLSQPSLALQYGGIYDVAVDVKYSLLPSAGAAEDIYVYGSTAMSVNCDNVSIRTQPLLEVKASQRCAATLLRSNYLIGTPVPGNPNACGATSYTFEFTPIDACGGTTTGGATEYATPTSTPYLPLGNLPSLPNMGAWRVRIRPNFTYGAGTYGPAQDIQVNNTASSAMAPESEINNNNEKDLTASVDANLYPNPNTGEMVNLNVSGVQSDNVFVRITDELGREVYSNRFTVDGSLNTIVTFAQPLANGAYNVSFTADGKVINERMVVTK